jgi:LacI family gluconate utilization system Gnt-I transcriptional repressor
VRRRVTVQSTNKTMADVARIAGVSSSTVSRALNEPLMVKKETVERVKQAIAKIGYTPNLLAGGLASSRSRMVALIVPTIANSIFAETVQATTDRLAEVGYQTILGLSGYDPQHERDLLRAILGRRPDGVILAGAQHLTETRAALLGAGIPIVEIWDMTPTPIDMLVGFSHEQVGRAVARHLHAAGYRAFGLISADDQRAMARRFGFVAELDSAGVTLVPEIIVQAPARLSLGREGFAQMLEAGHAPKVVVCSSDTIAQGVLAEAQSRGMRIPADVAVMGFGDLNFAADTWPALSTVRIDGARVGREAATAVLERLNGVESGRPGIIDVGFSIVERAST